MSAPASPTPNPVAPWRWGVVWLLFLATLLAYTDRLALNNTQRFLLPEFAPAPADPASLTDADRLDLARKRNQLYADINFAFGVAFALFQIPAGFLIDRFSLRWLYFGAIVVWSAAGVLTGFVPAGAVGALVACRVVLGIGEAFNWPCAVACVRRVIPRESRGLANGIFHSGASIGAVATPFLVLLLVNPDTGRGWRELFVAVGVVGAAWAVLWLWNTRGERAAAIDRRGEEPNPPTPFPKREGGASGANSPATGELLPTCSPLRFGEGSGEGLKPTPFLRVFTTTAFWVCLTTAVCVNVCWHFYTQWFPRYLTEDLRVSARGEQLVLAGFFVAADLGSMTSGWMIRRLTRGGLTVERSRQWVMTGLAAVVLAATVPAALLPASLLELKFGLFFVVAAAGMGGFAIFFGLAQDVAPRHTAKVLGVCGCVSWLAISGVTKAAGELAGPGRYAGLFVAVGCVPLGAALAGWRWPRPPDQGNASSPAT